MKPSQIANRLHLFTQGWDQDTKNFYLDFFWEMPYPELIASFLVAINTGSQSRDMIQSNLTIVQFESEPNRENINDYLDTFMNDDIMGYTWTSQFLIIEFSF